MEIAEFNKYSDGYYMFSFENGVDMAFEEVHPKVLVKYDLKNDDSLIGKTFNLLFTESNSRDDDGWVIYRIEYLELINTN